MKVLLLSTLFFSYAILGYEATNKPVKKLKETQELSFNTFSMLQNSNCTIQPNQDNDSDVQNLKDEGMNAVPRVWDPKTGLCRNMGNIKK